MGKLHVQAGEARFERVRLTPMFGQLTYTASFVSAEAILQKFHSATPWSSQLRLRCQGQPASQALFPVQWLVLLRRIVGLDGSNALGGERAPCLLARYLELDTQD